jgi:glucose/arabinose dehydrogenase
MSVSLFDSNFYRAVNSDLAKLSDAQAESHFQQYGLAEGRRFSPLVNLGLYRASNADLASFSNRQLLDHLQTYGVLEKRRFCEFVDLDFYQAVHADLSSFNGEQLLTHLQQWGINEGRRFSQFANLNFYRSNNGDLSGLSNRQLLTHLQQYGVQEGRRFSEFVDLGFYRSQNSDLAGFGNQDLLEHLQRYGLNEGRRVSPFVDLNWYRSQNADLSSFTGNQALLHLAVFGVNEGRIFSTAFDLNYYRSLNSDLATAGLSNLQLFQQFEQAGVNEGRITAPGFNSRVYLANNADLRAAGFGFQQAFQHFVVYGYGEGRPGSDYAGNSLATARTDTSTAYDFVGLGDGNDFYRIVVAAPSTLNAALSGLVANADLQLLNNSGGVIQTANAIGSANDAIALALSPGTYYLRVYQAAADQSTNYSLTTTLTPLSTGSIALGQTLYTVSEAGGSLVASLVRSGGSAGVATVDYTTVNATALDGQDYTKISGRLTFADGETSKTLTIPILNDNLVEGTETFNLALDAVSGAGLGITRTATITIVDDDAPPSIDFQLSNFNIQEGDGPVTVTLRRSGNTSSASSVTVTTSDGTALAGSDYTTNSEVVTFGIGETSKTFTVSIADDSTVAERNETINVTLSSPIGAALTAQNTTTITIADNDPGNFSRQTFLSGLNLPTSFDWSPDGSRMYVTEKSGVVRVAVNGTLSGTPFIDISAQVNSGGDRGLLGLAVHPDFVNNPYVYLAFTYDPPEAATGNGLAARDQVGNRPSRVIRVTADVTTNYTTAVAGSEVVLLGKNSTWANISGPDVDSTQDINQAPSGVLNYGLPNQTNVQDYLATDNQVHTINYLKFRQDGPSSWSLFVSNGDGASAGRVDPRAARTLDIDNLSGKILRIDPLTGQGYSDNPFYDGNADSNRSKVYNYGLRNPFRFTFDPITNEPVVGDVGWNTWEEINTGRGKNFGWPYYEGGGGVNLQTGGYVDLTAAQAYYSSNPVITPAIYSRTHTDGARAIIMGDYYTGNTFPIDYRGGLFIADVEEGTVNILRTEAGQLTVQRFASGLPFTVQITTGKDSNLYYVNIGSGEVGRWSFT